MYLPQAIVEGLLLNSFSQREGTIRKMIITLVFFIKVFLAFAVSSLSANFFVVLLKSSKILTGLGEFTLFHTLSNIPVDKGTLGIHQVELVINARQCLCDSSCVGNHANSALNTGKVTSRNDSGWLVVDSTFEASWTPVNKLNGTLSLDGGHSSVDILGNDVSTVHEAASHVLSVPRIAFGHHTSGLKDGVGNLGNRELLVVGLLCGDHGCVRGKHEVDTRVWNQVGLELGNIHVQGSIETK
mmetsp:Transcript_6919/g.9959  ORF Transcript_6919/g.9959 Transcript_6919/m.9959 type:complete len:242 (-) Transcript_6919:793-1518(-)